MFVISWLAGTCSKPVLSRMLWSSWARAANTGRPYRPTPAVRAANTGRPCRLTPAARWRTSWPTWWSRPASRQDGFSWAKTAQFAKFVLLFWHKSQNGRKLRKKLCLIWKHSTGRLQFLLLFLLIATWDEKIARIYLPKTPTAGCQKRRLHQQQVPARRGAKCRGSVFLLLPDEPQLCSQLHPLHHQGPQVGGGGVVMDSYSLMNHSFVANSYMTEMSSVECLEIILSSLISNLLGCGCTPAEISRLVRRSAHAMAD